MNQQSLVQTCYGSLRIPLSNKKKRKNKEKLLTHDKTCQNLDCILLSGRSNNQKITRCLIPSLVTCGQGKQ